MDINAIKGANLDVASVGQTVKTSKNETAFDFTNWVNKASESFDVNKSTTIASRDSSQKSYDQFSYRKNEVKDASGNDLKDKINENQDKIESYSKAVIKEVSDALEVSEDNVIFAMETLGLTALDLQNPQNLSELVSQITGEQSTELILSSDFLNLMGNVEELGKNLLGELDLASEQLISLQETYTAMQQDTVEESGVETDAAVEDNKKEQLLESKSVLDTENSTDTTETSSSFEIVNSQRGDSSNNDSGMFQGNMTNQNMEANNIVSDAAVDSSVEFSYTSTETLELISKVADNVRVLVETDTTSMEMQLNPENLGKIYLNVSSKEGAVNATIAAQNEEVRNALEMQVATLRENLNQAGIKVDAIEVTIASHEFERNLEQNEQQQQNSQQEEQNSKGRTNISMDSMDELIGVMSEEEMLVAQMMKDNGNSVDFTA